MKMEMVNLKLKTNLIIILIPFVLLVFPVSVSGMITLPVTAQMYHSLVQQQLPNSENTVCVTPMQVFANSNNLCSNLVNNSSSSTTTTYQIMTTTANLNRNVLNFPFTNHSINKNAIISKSNNKSRVVANVASKKSILKKKAINLATVSKPNLLSATTKNKVVKIKSTSNNNKDCVKNMNNLNKCEKKIKSKPKLESKATKKEADTAPSVNDSHANSH